MSESTDGTELAVATRRRYAFTPDEDVYALVEEICRLNPRTSRASLIKTCCRSVLPTMIKVIRAEAERLQQSRQQLGQKDKKDKS